MKTDSAQIQYDKMTKTPINKLVLQLGLPTTVSMLVTSVYNMADTFFVSQLGTSVSGATGVVFALMAIINAFGFMFGHGAGSNISRKLGAHDIKSARKFASTSFFLSLLCGTLICILGFLFHSPFMHLLGSTDSILPYAIDYSTWSLIAAPAMASSCVMNNILLVLKRGVGGACISTSVSQYLCIDILISPFLRGKVQSRLSIRYVTHQFEDVTNILATGFPSLMRQGLNSVSVMVLNRFAGPYGDAAIAAMSIVTRIINFLFCVALGIGQGFQPVSAFNYGAGKYKRVRDAFWFSIKSSFVVMSISAFIGITCSAHIVRMFRDDPAVLAIGIPALRIQCFALFFMPLSLYGNMLFQSIGKSGRATFLSMIRSGLVFIPVLWLMNTILGLTGIQISQTISDVISAAITLPMVVKFFKTMPKDM